MTGTDRQEGSGPAEKDNDHSLMERKIGAVVGALFKAKQKGRGLSGSLAHHGVPHSTLSGDFFWARNTDDVAVIVVGDASGHDAYAGLLSVVVGNSLDDLAKRFNKKTLAPNKLLTKLAERFQAVMLPAIDKLHELKYDDCAHHMSKEGFGAVACVVRDGQAHIASAGLPAFVVGESGKIAQVGTYENYKTIAAKPRIDKTRKMDGVDKTKEEQIVGNVEIHSDARFVVFATDGIVEQRSTANGVFGQNNLIEALKAHVGAKGKSVNANSLVNTVYDALRCHQNGAPAEDDQLVVVLDIGKWNKTHINQSNGDSGEPSNRAKATESRKVRKRP